jgi:O-antigen ligase
VAFVVLYALQSLYSTDFPKALETLVFFYVPFALLLKLLADVPWSRRIVTGCLGVVLALALAFVLVGFWEYATRRLLLNPKVIAANQFESYFRVNSLFFDPNIYGRFLVMVMVAVCGVLLWAQGVARVLMATAALAALWAGLVLTFSQSSFGALLVGLAVLAGLRWRTRPAVLSGVGVTVVASAVVVLSPGLGRLEEGAARSLDRATSGRFELVRGGVEMFLDRPLVGWGSGSFSERYREREDVTSRQATAASHTIPVTVAAEQGLIGLAGYGAVLLASLHLLFGRMPPLRGGLPPPPEAVARAVVAAAFAALVLHTLLYAAFLEDPIAWTMVGAALGLRLSAGATSASTVRVPAAAPGRSASAARPFRPPRRRTGSSSP